MQKLKKALALLLTLCMLIGLPLSLNVAATGDPSVTPTQQTARLVQALFVPDSWGTDLPGGRSVQLHFNCTITANPAPVAYIALVDARGLCAQVNPLTGTRTNGTVTTIWDADFESGSYVTLRASQVRNYHPNCDTIPEILALAEKTGLTPVVRLRESVDTISLDNTVYGLNVGTTGLGMLSTPNGVDGNGCTVNGQVFLNVEATRNGYDYIDVPITTAEQAPSLKYVETNGTIIRPIFSEPMYWDGRSADANPTHLRVVNSKGQIVYTNGTNFSIQKLDGYYAIGNYGNTDDALGLYHNTFFSAGSASSAHALNAVPYEGGTRDWSSVYSDCVTKCATLNKNHFNGDRYSVALVIEENADALAAQNGESAGNFRLDSMWTSDMVPLMATHSDEAGDRVVVPLCTSAEIVNKATADPNTLTLKSVSISSTPGLPDRVLIEFSKPIASLGYAYCGIRLYNAHGNVESYADGTGQWDVSKWERYGTDGTQWIGEIQTKHNSNTLSQIQDWIVSQGLATNTNGTFTLLNKYRLEFAIADSHGVPNDRIITLTQATDGTCLFANDSPFSLTGEERAGLSYDWFNRFDAVTIEDVDIYADKYVLIDFNQDITWNTALFYNGLCVFDNEKSNLTATNGTDYAPLGTSGYTTNLQRAFTSWTYYGNRKDVVVATLADGDYAWLADHLTKANAISPGRYDLRLRLQDKPAELTENQDKAVDGITALNFPLSHLYTAASGTYSTVYFAATHYGEEAASAELVQARLVASDQAILSFSTAVTAVDINHIHLVHGNKTYPITSAEVSGNYVTVTFDGVALHDGMGIRIDGGADYRIPTSVITTENGAVVYANETATSAYTTAEITEAAAQVSLNGTYYLNMSSVWSKQKAGDTIVLHDDVDMTDSIMMVLSADVTLDLNGHTLTVPYFFSFGQVVDPEGKGLLAMTADGVNSSASLQTDNRQLPLYDKKSGGYRFFDYDIENLGIKQTLTTDNIVTSIKYGIRLHFDNNIAYTLLQEAENTDVSLTMDLFLRFPNRKTSHLTYTFSHKTLSLFAAKFPANADQAITLTINGLKSMAIEAMSQPTALVIDTHSTLRAACGVEHDSTTERTHIGITPAQAAVNWIRARIANNDLVSFNYNGSAANLNAWTKTESGAAITPDANWTRTVTYTKDSVDLAITVSFNKEHASLEWVGNWTYSGSNASNRIANVRMLSAAFPITNATMTTANQGGRNSIFDYQPYSVDLAQKGSYSMANTGGRSSQGAWPYFDLTSDQNTYGIMGAIGWTGNWSFAFTHNADNTVKVSAGMQTTDYQMVKGESLRTPSIVIQFFKGTQDDGHNAWRQLVLDAYTPDNVHTYGEKNTPCAPISISTWGGVGEDRMIETLNKVTAIDQYFEHQWIDAGWYGDYLSENASEKITVDGVTDYPWHLERGNWYYNPGFTTTDADHFYGGFDKLNQWHTEYGKNTGLIVWFEPGRVEGGTIMADTAASNGSYTHPITGKTWKSTYSLSGSRIVNYGIPEAREYFEALILHFLDDMNATYYRQDYNFDPAAYWTKTDTAEESKSGLYTYRDGVAEIKYVTGHYQLLDSIRNAGYQIDSCASGGQMLDIEMMKRSIPLWRSDYTGTAYTVASGIRSQGANLSWWLPISGGVGSAEGVHTEYGFRSTMASGITMSALPSKAYADKMINELLHNRDMMLGDYYILQQGLHEGLTFDAAANRWVESDATKDYTNVTNAAYEFYLEDEGRGYVVAFRPTYSNDDRDTVLLKGLDRHADYTVTDADTGETATYTGRYLMEQGLDLRFPDIRTSHMIYFTKQ